MVEHQISTVPGMLKGFRAGRFVAVFVAGLMLVACAETQFIVHTAKRVGKPAEEPPAVDAGIYKVGNPYQIKGVWYHPKEDFEYEETGIASWYGSKFHGRKTANGERFDMNFLSAAHRTLPMPSIVRVTNLENGRTLNLKVNDRGPFARGRILDVSRRAAQLLGFEKQGTARVHVAILGNESRTLAWRLKGEAELAAVGSPITVSRLPKPAVSSESLAPPSGASVAPAPVEVVTMEAPEAAPDAAIENPVVEVVSVAVVNPTNLFVQAGAFALYDNANKARAMLAGLGDVRISSVLIGGRDLYRVRVGPLNDVGAADGMLDQVIQAGYTDARIIVD